MIYTDADSPDAIKFLEEFEKRADEKLHLRRDKYGPLHGDTPFNKIIDHLFDEFVELVIALYPEYYEAIFDELKRYSVDRFKQDKGKDVEGELFDLHNIAKIAYMCGKIQKVI